MPLELPQAIREDLAKEFRIAADLMKEAPDLPSRVYVFSAFYGAVNRALNASWNNDLSLLLLVLQATHAAISSRWNQVAAGRDRPIQVPNEVSDKLTMVADNLATMMAANDPNESALFAILVELAALGYSTTGNGFYLYLKGDLKL